MLKRDLVLSSASVRNRSTPSISFPFKVSVESGYEEMTVNPVLLILKCSRQLKLTEWTKELIQALVFVCN